MPTFLLTAPDGKKYHVTGENAEGAYSALQQSLGNTPAPAPSQADIAGAAAQPSGGPDMKDYYSSGMYAGKYNPLGKIASVIDPTYSSAKPAAAPTQLDNYYDSGIYQGGMNPLGPIARSIDAATTGADDMLTFGGADEMQGALPGGNVEDARARRQELYASNPVASTVGQVAGGVAGATELSAVGNALQKIPGVAQAVQYGASFLPSAATGLGTALRMGTQGAEIGGLYGYGSGDDGNRLQNAGINAAIGATVGAGIPAVASGVSAAYRNTADTLARGTLARQAGVEPGVADFLTQRLQADNVLGPQGAANMAAAGPEAMLVDAGPSAQGALDAAVVQGGPGASTASQRIADRVGRHSQAVTDALDTSLGVPEGVGTAQRTIRQGSRAAVHDAYEGPNGAYAQPIDYASPEGRQVEDIINRIPPRIANRAIQQANERMVYDGMPNQQIRANIADDGSITYHEMPNVRQADAIKRALNDIASEGTDDITGKLTPDAQFAARMGSDLRNAVRDAVPEYRTALATAADPLSRESAVDLGSRLLSPNMTRDRIAQATANFTDPERDALAQGVRSNIDDIMANVKRTVANGDTDSISAYKAIKELSSPSNRQKLTAALGAQRVDPLLNMLDEAATSFQAQGNIAAGSRTAGRTETIRAVKDMNAPGPIQTALSGEPLNATKKVAQMLSGNTPAARQSLTDESFRQIADVLTRPANQAVNDFQAMVNYGGQTAANRARASLIARLLSGAGPAARPLALRSGEKSR